MERRKSGCGLEVLCGQVPGALRVVITPDTFAAFSADPPGFLETVAVALPGA